MVKFEKLSPPTSGTPITWQGNTLTIPDDPIIPFIEGDGIGPDITAAMKLVLDSAVKIAYGGKKRLAWFEVYAGEKANDKFGEWLPKDTVTAVETYLVAIKGPLTTPIGGGIRSLNVSLRQIMDLYACVRPCRWVKGTPNPVKSPDKLDVVIFRENTEDVYSGIEYKKGSPEAEKLITWLKKELGANIRPDSGVGIKPISEFGTKRLVRRAIQFAIDQGRKSVTIVHKGNIMKFTEGAFRDWGYELAKEEFGDKTVSEQDLWDKHGGKLPEGKILINDRIADQMFMQVLLRPDEYSVLAMPNLNGDYLSDACAAQIGGLGMAPGSNVGDKIAFFEATHGTAPKYANKNMVNPGSLILSGVMMLEHLCWFEAADLVRKGLEGAILAKTVTYDLERQIEGATKVGTREFGEAIVKHMK